MVQYTIQIALLLLVALYAWRRGGKPEKQIASILVGMHLASLSYALLVGNWTDYSGMPLFRIMLDLAGLGLITLVGLRANRWWPLWVASLQLVTVFAHALRIIDAQVPPLIYAVMEQWPFWIMIVITGIGTQLRHRRGKLQPH